MPPVAPPASIRLAAHPDGRALYHGTIVGCWRRHPTQNTSRHAYRLVRERWRVIRDVVAQLDPAARAAMGWTDATERENRSRWCIWAGRAASTARPCASGRGSRCGSGRSPA